MRLVSSAGFVPGAVIYIGKLGVEGCERAQVASVAADGHVGLSAPLKGAHGAYSDVTAVLGDRIKIYRAAYVDGTAPATGDFTELATRSIDADHLSTYYRDPNGSDAYWYRLIYYNETTGDATALESSVIIRGSEHGAYCSLREIREEASALNARSLPDTTVEQCRTNAQSEINAALKNVYGAKVPFDPVPDLIRTLTIQLAAGLLYQVRYPGRESLWEGRLKDARAVLKQLQTRDVVIGGDDGSTLATGRLSFYPDVTAPRAFKRGMRF